MDVVNTYRTALTEKVADATNQTLRHITIEHDNPTLHSMLLGLIESTKIPGVKNIRTGLDTVRKKLSDIDAELGYQMGGGQTKGIGALLFRDKDERNLVPIDLSTGNKRYIRGNETITPTHFEHFEYPSVTKPVKALGNIVVPTLAFAKGIDILEGSGGKNLNGQSTTN